MLGPMKLIMASEFASTGAPEISVFHKLSVGNGRKPFKLAPWPALIAQEVFGVPEPPLLPPPEVPPFPVPPFPCVAVPPPQPEKARAQSSNPRMERPLLREKDMRSLC